MARLFSNDELALVDNWATKAKQERNFNDADEVGKEMLRLCEGYNPINETVLEAIAAAMQAKGWSVFRSNDEMAYNAAYDALPQSGKDAFAAWWGRQGSAVDKSAKAATLLINWCAGRGVTQANLDLAMGNLASKGVLQIKQPHEYRGGIYSGRTDLTDSTPKEHMLDTHGRPMFPGHESGQSGQQFRAKLEREAAAGRSEAIPDSEWQRKAESVDSNLNSTRQAMKRIFVTRPDKTTIDWKATYEARYQFAGSGDGRGSGKSV